jgi:hypothetical protein
MSLHFWFVHSYLPMTCDIHGMTCVTLWFLTVWRNLALVPVLKMLQAMNFVCHELVLNNFKPSLHLESMYICNM